MAIFGRRRFWAAVAVLWLITLGMIGLGRFIPASPLALQDTPNTQLITNPALWMIDPRTGVAHRLQQGNDSLPIWSPDGQSYITNTWQSGYYYETDCNQLMLLLRLCVFLPTLDVVGGWDSFLFRELRLLELWLERPVPKPLS